MVMRTYTPNLISSLKENEIFVFGSNLDGLYHLVESYTSEMGAGRNLLIYCISYGYFRPRVLSHEELSRYLQTYGDEVAVC